jgi:hypothetical protein
MEEGARSAGVREVAFMPIDTFIWHTALDRGTGPWHTTSGREHLLPGLDTIPEPED